MFVLCCSRKSLNWRRRWMPSWQTRRKPQPQHLLLRWRMQIQTPPGTLIPPWKLKGDCMVTLKPRGCYSSLCCCIKNRKNLYRAPTGWSFRIFFKITIPFFSVWLKKFKGGDVDDSCFDAVLLEIHWSFFAKGPDLFNKC